MLIIAVYELVMNYETPCFESSSRQAFLKARNYAKDFYQNWQYSIDIYIYNCVLSLYFVYKV